MNKRRLLKLAEFLETGDIHGEFFLGMWGSNLDAKRPECGTTGCAFGWATTIPAFRRAGLKFEGGAPAYQGLRAYYAAQNFFSITSHDAANLFCPDNYPDSQLEGMRSRKAVARRIRKLCEAA